MPAKPVNRKKRASGADAMPPLAETEAVWRRGNIGRLMFNGARRFEERIHVTVKDAGFRDIRFVHLTLTRNMNAGGTRLTTLAARAGMTKQAMGQLVDECERLGVVERRPDPSDRRARIIAFTRRGRRLLDALHQGISDAEAEMEAIVGKSSLSLIREALREYGIDDAEGDVGTVAA